MKAVQIITGSLAAGLAAAFLAGAAWGQNADITWDPYIINGDVVTVVGAVGGALLLALAALLLYLGVRPRRDRDVSAEGPSSRARPGAPAA
jgi:hypothetical protein